MKKHDWYRAFFVFARGIKPSLQIVVSFGIVGAILHRAHVSVRGIRQAYR
ncbi:hypothetical protein MTsN2n4_28390 [Pseudoalteromonas sp. MTN2-4]